MSLNDNIDTIFVCVKINIFKKLKIIALAQMEGILVEIIEFFFQKTKDFKLVIPMEQIKGFTGSEIKVEATMTEFMSGEIVQGFARTKVISSSIKIRFLTDQPMYFKPSMPIHLYVSMNYYLYS